MESLFILHQVTGDPQYQEWGWHVFRAFEKFSKVDSGGYANLDSVLSVSSSANPVQNTELLLNSWLYVLNFQAV